MRNKKGFTGQTFPNGKLDGFTLIELMVVIVILTILAGTVLTVLNPGRMSDKAKEGVIKANTDKMAQAMMACAGSTTDPYNRCDEETETGINRPNGNPAGSWYDLYRYSDNYLRSYGCYVNSSGQCCYLITLRLSDFYSWKETAWTATNCRDGW